MVVQQAITNNTHHNNTQKSSNNSHNNSIQTQNQQNTNIYSCKKQQKQKISSLTIKVSQQDKIPSNPNRNKIQQLKQKYPNNLSFNIQKSNQPQNNKQNSQQNLSQSSPNHYINELSRNTQSSRQQNSLIQRLEEKYFGNISEYNEDQEERYCHPEYRQTSEITVKQLSGNSLAVKRYSKQLTKQLDDSQNGVMRHQILTPLPNKSINTNYQQTLQKPSIQLPKPTSPPSIHSQKNNQSQSRFYSQASVYVQNKRLLSIVNKLQQEKLQQQKIIRQLKRVIEDSQSSKVKGNTEIIVQRKNKQKIFQQGIVISDLMVASQKLELQKQVQELRQTGKQYMQKLVKVQEKLKTKDQAIQQLNDQIVTLARKVKQQEQILTQTKLKLTVVSQQLQCLKEQKSNPIKQISPISHNKEDDKQVRQITNNQPSLNPILGQYNISHNQLQQNNQQNQLQHTTPSYKITLTKDDNIFADLQRQNTQLWQRIQQLQQLNHVYKQQIQQKQAQQINYKHTEIYSSSAYIPRKSSSQSQAGEYLQQANNPYHITISKNINILNNYQNLEQQNHELYGKIHQLELEIYKYKDLLRQKEQQSNQNQINYRMNYQNGNVSQQINTNQYITQRMTFGKADPETIVSNVIVTNPQQIYKQYDIQEENESPFIIDNAQEEENESPFIIDNAQEENESPFIIDNAQEENESPLIIDNAQQQPQDCGFLKQQNISKQVLKSKLNNHATGIKVPQRSTLTNYSSMPQNDYLSQQSQSPTFGQTYKIILSKDNQIYMQQQQQNQQLSQRIIQLESQIQKYQQLLKHESQSLNNSNLSNKHEMVWSPNVDNQYQTENGFTIMLTKNKNIFQNQQTEIQDLENKVEKLEKLILQYQSLYGPLVDKDQQYQSYKIMVTRDDRIYDDQEHQIKDLLKLIDNKDQQIIQLMKQLSLMEQQLYSHQQSRISSKPQIMENQIMRSKNMQRQMIETQMTEKMVKENKVIEKQIMEDQMMEDQAMRNPRYSEFDFKINIKRDQAIYQELEQEIRELKNTIQMLQQRIQQLNEELKSRIPSSDTQQQNQQRSLCQASSNKNTNQQTSQLSHKYQLTCSKCKSLQSQLKQTRSNLLLQQQQNSCLGQELGKLQQQKFIITSTQNQLKIQLEQALAELIMLRQQNERYLKLISTGQNNNISNQMHIQFNPHQIQTIKNRNNHHLQSGERVDQQSFNLNKMELLNTQLRESLGILEEQLQEQENTNHILERRLSTLMQEKQIMKEKQIHLNKELDFINRLLLEAKQQKANQTQKNIQISEKIQIQKLNSQSKSKELLEELLTLRQAYHQLQLQNQRQIQSLKNQYQNVNSMLRSQLRDIQKIIDKNTNNSIKQAVSKTYQAGLENVQTVKPLIMLKQLKSTIIQIHAERLAFSKNLANNQCELTTNIDEDNLDKQISHFILNKITPLNGNSYYFQEQGDFKNIQKSDKLGKTFVNQLQKIKLLIMKQQLKPHSSNQAKMLIEKDKILKYVKQLEDVANRSELSQI